MNIYKAGTQVGLFLTRAALGGFLLLAGWEKAAGELDQGVGSFYKASFQGMAPGWLPGWFGAPYGYALPWLELLVGGMLVLGLFTRFFAIGGFLILTSITAAAVSANGSITGLAKAAEGVPGPPFNTTYIQAAVYFLLIFTGAGVLSLDYMFSKRRKKAGGKP